MLVLSRLQDSLSQVLAPPELHTVVLLTPSGQLVSFSSYPSRSKDEIRVIAGLSGEVWQETQEEGSGMVDSEPLMLLVLNSTEAVEWDDLQAKGKALASQMATPLAKFRQHLTVRKPPPMPSAVTSPARAR
ncbi:hypothetical protein B0H17DRAFT_1113456 [Mycena rosella]|uniref:Roadblock/LAMTOR2 domain-containing protein n=1 Tax=Mycena rosella TaxID=1033263 RepID=A0AAD7FHQ2_MYCRO|nr:hypothetical protein B0H17DRAFT_1113456 [Mycena rosella]